MHLESTESWPDSIYSFTRRNKTFYIETSMQVPVIKGLLPKSVMAVIQEVLINMVQIE